MAKNVVVHEIKSNNSNNTIRNVLNDSDDTFWMSNGTKSVEIEIKYEGAADSLTIDFQKGFQPKNIRTIEYLALDSNGCKNMDEVFLLKSDSKVKIPLKPEMLSQPDAHCLNGIVLQFGETYDLYGRICIYSIIIE